MISSIILTTDFSDNSRKAADYVFSHFTNARIIFFHAYGTPQVGRNVLINIDDILEKDARNDFAEEEKRLAEKFGKSNLNYDKVLVNADFETGLVEAIKNKNPQLLVMGTKGAGAIQGKLFGSNASKMIGKSTLPLLLIPDDYLPNNADDDPKVALATDLMPVKHPHLIMDFVHLLFQDKTARFDVLNVVKPDTESHEGAQKEQLMQSLTDLNPVFHRIMSNNISEGIESFVDLNNHDILIMIHRHHSFIEKLFKSSVSRNLALSVKVPTLVINE